MSKNKIRSAQFLDEITLATKAIALNVVNCLDTQIGQRVGPVLEYELFRRNGGTHLPPLRDHTHSPIAHRIICLLDGKLPENINLSLHPADSDAIAIPSSLGRHPGWTAFVKRAEVSARSVGFPDSIAAGLAGAIGELADNVVQHSEAPSSGIATFARSPRKFEYAIGDSGIGMLASLQRANEFHSLSDDLEALPLAITAGVSRRGRDKGYGYGYRAVFLPLRAAEGTIRLRSGKAVLEIAGIEARPDEGICSQRPHQQGVVVSAEISTISGRSG